MNVVAVSVILPAYNCEKFIGKAIQSLLDQTFTNFELIIVNDGSTDNTEFAIIAFDDPRIVYIKNQKNQGLIFSLNRAIDMAQGKYIARMDADDICKPDRLLKQKTYLDENQEAAMCATTIDLINETGNMTGVWELDRQTTTSKQIKRQLIYQNCIAHPTIMVRTEIIKNLKYSPRQANIEDYDLWLRLLSNGYRIDKIDEPLLLYRIHGNSITDLYLKKKNPFFKHLRMKWTFLAKEMSSGHINGFILKVIGSTLIDLVRGTGKAIKNFLKK